MSNAATSDLLFDEPKPSSVVINPHGQSQVLLVCEHASNHIPVRYEGLGLTDTDKTSHAAWDPGAQAVSERMSEVLDAQLVVSTVSRLVYDCNRPPTSVGAIRTVSEKIKIPGNETLTAIEQIERVETVYHPFKQLLSETLKSFSTGPVLVTIHSFTRTYNGHRRDVDVGIIHDADARLAKAMVGLSGGALGMKFALNEPYSKADEVAHTLELHGTNNGLINVMIEVCNDLIDTPEQQDAAARMLADLLIESLSEINEGKSSEGAA